MRAIAILFAAATAADAQPPSDAPSCPPARATSAAPDVVVRAPADSTWPARGAATVLRAEAAAREVTFARAPRRLVRPCGGTGDSVRALERRDLPDRVEAERAYRDVYVPVEITGRATSQCVAALARGAGVDAAACPRAAAESARPDSLARPRSPR